MNHTLQHYSDAPSVMPGIDAKRMYASDSFEVVHLTLKPGEGMNIHVMPFEVVFFVAEGQGTLFADPEEVRAVEGDCISVKAGTRRAWKNAWNGPLRLVVMKLLK